MEMNFDRWLGIIGLVFAVIGLALSWYFYIRGKREKRPYQRIKSYNIIEDDATNLVGLDITYEGKKIASLTVSKIQFWNDGEETIKSEDLKTINPLRICAIKGVEILSARVIEANNTSSLISCVLQKETNDVILDFVYLDTSHGAVIQVVHTGLRSSDLFITGDIIGVKYVQNANEVTKKNINLVQKGIRVSYLVFLCVMAYYFLFIMAPKFANTYGSASAGLESILILLILLVGFSSIMEITFKLLFKTISPLIARYFPGLQRRILSAKLTDVFEKRPKGLQGDD